MTTPSTLQKIAWTVLLLLAALMFMMASRYLSLDPETYFPEQKAVYIANTAGLLLHIIGAMIAMLIGPFQFLPVIRRRWLNLHRWLGHAYLLGVLSGGLGGLYMASLAIGGWPTRLGFTGLALSWLFSAAMAYRHIRNKDIQHHRQWMLRNYALTFAAVTLRLGQIVFALAGVNPLSGYTALSWLSWVINLLIAEWLIHQLLPANPQPSIKPATQPLTTDH